MALETLPQKGLSLVSFMAFRMFFWKKGFLEIHGCP